ncbi:MAG: REP-associated tyrosine transposase, partial [Gammaproteobacteria bacterium]
LRGPRKSSKPPGGAEPQPGAPSSSSAKITQGKARASRPRKRLPHFDSQHAYQFVTFRLADSLPREKLSQMEAELRPRPDDQRKRIEFWLDSGLGCCALRHPVMAQVMQDTLQHFDGQRYHLLAWCIMPNHVHVLIETLAPLAKIVQSWKSFTGRWALQHAAELELGVPGEKFWMRDYWDRYIRNERHFLAVVDYIHANPAKAGLCAQPADWRWSSARAGAGP